MREEEIKSLVGDLSAVGLGKKLKRDHPLGSLTTYRVGGSAALYYSPESKDELSAFIETVADYELPILLLGNGSNMLVSDRGFEGLVLKLGLEFENISIEDNKVVAGGAASMPVIARKTVAEGLTGFEWSVGVPGLIGGAVRMNAGGHGSEMAKSVKSATVLDIFKAKEVIKSSTDLEFGYRTSSIRTSEVILEVTLQLESGPPEQGNLFLEEIVRWRRENQPGGQNTGSVFMNPSGDFAGRLIDLSGLKGLSYRSAKVSEKHANFIQVNSGGSASDVFHLMSKVREIVFENYGVQLVPETVLVGFDT